VRFGVHLNIGKGLVRAAEHGVALGCECAQVFVRNPRGWAAGRFDEQAAATFVQITAEAGIRPLAAHSSYLINLASPDPALRTRSLQAVLEDCRRARMLGCRYLVLHAGHHRGSGLEAGLEAVATALQEVLAAAMEPMLLLENTAGAGSEVGHTWHQLASVLNRLPPARTGMCLDTCHAHVAGYDVSSAEGVEIALAGLQRELGLARLHLVHLNDARALAGSRWDAHEHIGEGTIGEEGFRALLHHPALRDLPGILETPHRTPDDDARMLSRLRVWAA